MNKYLWSRRGGPLVIVCLALLFYSTFMPAAHARSAQLIIHRAANFGALQWLRIWIDGKEVKAVGYGHDFTGPISPGHHVIAVIDSDNQENRPPTKTTVDVTAGETHEYTAVWSKNRVFLVKN